MDGKKAYNTFNSIMLFILIFIGLSLFAILVFSKTSLFGKKDDYGCNNSAGFVYSFAKNECVQVYEEALKLNKAGSNNPNELKAFIVFSKDNKFADIFLPGKIHSLLYADDNFTKWEDNLSKYILYNMPDKLSLCDDEQEIFYINR